MKIRSLEQTPLADVVEALLVAFADYFVKFPTEISYWEKRFRLSRVRWDLSYGHFVADRLVSFIINGVDERGGQRIAFNTGTGVYPDYRGRALVDQLYERAFSHFRAAGITHCQLEVIQENTRAIAVYQRIGFSIDRGLCLWKGALRRSEWKGRVEATDFAWVRAQNAALERYCAWDNTNAAVDQLGEEVSSFRVWDQSGQPLGYFLAKAREERCLLVQFEAWEGRWEALLAAIAQQYPGGVTANVDDRRPQVLAALKRAGCTSVIDQYEMSMAIPDVGK
ncbi:MAG: GNAT family N-acetyltransferase [Bacteroidota bacterium]